MRGVWFGKFLLLVCGLRCFLVLHPTTKAYVLETRSKFRVSLFSRTASNCVRRGPARSRDTLIIVISKALQSQYSPGVVSDATKKAKAVYGFVTVSGVVIVPTMRMPYGPPARITFTPIGLKIVWYPFHRPHTIAYSDIAQYSRSSFGLSAYGKSGQQLLNYSGLQDVNFANQLAQHGVAILSVPKLSGQSMAIVYLIGAGVIFGFMVAMIALAFPGQALANVTHLPVSVVDFGLAVVILSIYGWVRSK